MLEFWLIFSSAVFSYLFFFLNGLVADINGAGPLAVYERRISAGELVDGDICQVCNIYIYIGVKFQLWKIFRDLEAQNEKYFFET